VGLILFRQYIRPGDITWKTGSLTGVPVKDVIDIAIYSMGLNDVTPFKPEEKNSGITWDRAGQAGIHDHRRAGTGSEPGRRRPWW